MSDEKSQGITFAVEPNIKLGNPLPKQAKDALKDAWASKGGIESFSPAPEGVVRVFTERNLLAEAVHEAFYKHYPLVLSPDVIWLTIAQGLANHVDQNASSLRSKFVKFQGKKELVVSRPEFVKGSPQNDWASVFPEFSRQIAINSGDEIVKLIESDFSTTGPIERVVSHITLMDAVQHYYTYVVMCGCGIPSITLLGTVQDWESIRAKAAALSQFELDWWLQELLPVLDHFVTAAQGNPDIQFWRSICNFTGGSGMPGDPISGWLQAFFPYLNASKEEGGGWFRGRDVFVEAKDDKATKKLQKNNQLGAYKTSLASGITATSYQRGDWDMYSKTGRGIKLKDIPPGLSSAPFTLKDLSTGSNYNMAFLGGVTTLVQDPKTLALQPKMGWAVLEQK